jgi:hypothetical protein
MAAAAPVLPTAVRSRLLLMLLLMLLLLLATALPLLLRLLRRTSGDGSRRPLLGVNPARAATAVLLMAADAEC